MNSEIILDYSRFSIEELAEKDYTTAQSFMKEKVEKNLFREISKEAYKEFVENLKEFWLEDLREFKPERGFTLTIRFMSAGLTAASVFRCEVDICGDIATPKVVVCKYDEKENIEIESQNFRMVIKSGESVFPDIQKAQAFENGMALLTMRSAIESKSAITVFSAIKFILDKYGQNERMLEFYAKVFANHTGIVYRDMRDKLYHTPNAHWTSQDSFRGLYAGKTDLKVLDDKTKASPNGTFSERLKKVCLDTGLEYESFLNFLSTFPDCRALLSGVAIHKDLNPNNILLAIGEDSDRNEIISPMLIDFFEMQYKENERGENWLPLLFDFSRFEAQMFLYYFSYLSKSSNSKEVFFQSFKRLIDALNRGRLVKINSADPAVISNEALSYIFTIFFKLRGYVFRDLAELGIEKKLIYQNYLSSLSSFYFSFLKMDKEEAFQDKWNFSLLAADTCRKNIIELTDKLDYDSIYRESKSDRLHIGDSMMALLERKRYHHIALSDNLQKVKDFLHSDKQILYIESSPGMGKSSFLAYICDALNDNIPESELPGNVFCIPVFFDDKDKAKVKERETNRALKTKEEQNIELNFQDIADYFVQILCAAFHKVDKAPEEKSTDRFIRLCHEIYPELEQKKQQVVFLVDALDRNFIELEHYVLTNRLPGRFQYILSSRPQNPRWESFYNEQRQFFRSETYKLAEFSKDDIRALFQEWKVSPELTEEEAALLHEKTGGYPIYVEFIRRLLVAEKGRAAKMRREELKERLHSFSKEGFERELFDYYDELVKSKNKIVKQVLFCLVLAKDYLSAAHLARILYEELEREYHTDIEADLIDVLKDDILPVIREVLEYDENQNFRIFHRSYERYLEEKYQGKGGLRDFRATFFRYLKQYRDYAENEEERVHFLYCKNYLGLHLYEWAQSEKSYQEKFDTIFAEIFSMEEEEYRLWKKPLKAMVYWMMENQPYNETEFMLTFLKSQIPAIFSYRYFLFLTEIIEKKKNKGYDTTWNASLHFLNLELIQALSKSEPNNTQYKRDISVSYDRIADVYVSRGETDKALKHFTESLLIAEQLSNSEPNNSLYKRDISVSYNRLADVYVSRGETDKALKHFTESLLIAEQLSKSEPNNTQYKRDISVSYDRLADVYVSRGETDKALKHFTESLLIAEQLSKSEPNNTQYKRDISIYLNKIADVYVSRGETDKALEYYTESLLIAEQLSNSEPNNTQYKRDISIYLNKIADVYVSRGETDKALEYYTESLLIAEQLSKSEPNNSLYKRDISVSFNNIADIYVSRGETDKALEYYTESLQIAEQLSNSEPNNTQYKRDISVSYDRIADVYVSRGETDKALEYYTESLLIAEQLSNSEPNNTQYKRDIVHSLIKKGNILIFKGDVGKAKSSYEKALSLINVDVIDVSIFFTKLKAEVLQGLVTVSMMDSEEQDSDKIFSYSLEALSLWEKLKEEYGTIDIQVLNGLGKSNFLLAVLSGNLETGEQRKYIHKAIKNLLEVHKIQADNPDVLMMLSNAYSMLGNDYLEKEETEKAREVIEKSINYSRALVEKFPENYNYKQSIIFPLISIAQLEDDESKAIEYLKEAYETIIALEKKGYHIPGIEEMKNWIQSVIEGNEE